jgi:hypothetical protein
MGQQPDRLSGRKWTGQFHALGQWFAFDMRPHQIVKPVRRVSIEKSNNRRMLSDRERTCDLLGLSGFPQTPEWKYTKAEFTWLVAAISREHGTKCPNTRQIGQTIGTEDDGAALPGQCPIGLESRKDTAMNQVFRKRNRSTSGKVGQQVGQALRFNYPESGQFIGQSRGVDSVRGKQGRHISISADGVEYAPHLR